MEDNNAIKRLLRADLPQPGSRMTHKRKADILDAIRGGTITREEARSCYNLSTEELSLWEERFRKYGPNGLRTTRGSHYRSREHFGS